jgi:hypothetical protein
MKVIREIKAVGIRDWLWFVIYMRRDEFHRRLDGRNTMAKRNRAHRVDMKLQEGK